jgi:Domain of Unknown Function with PDB structure (DUF3857)/Transglutaminase-like superfamily
MFKKLSITVLLLLLISVIASAQEIVTVPAFGKIDIADLQMKECSFEKDAAAMHLLKYEEVDFTSNDNYNKVTTQKRFRIKIFNSNGFKHANLALTYMGGDKDFKLSNLEGATYNLDENGQVKISPLNTSDIFKDRGEKKKSVTSLRFTLPDLKPGCIIEYRYSITEKESSFIAPWYFQDEIPNLLSACKITMPYYSSLTKRIIGNFSVEEGSAFIQSNGTDKQKVQRSFAVRNIPSFKSEPFMSSSNDYKQKIEFLLDPYESQYEATLRESNNSWLNINLKFLGSWGFGWQFDIAVEGTENFVDSTKKLKTIAEKVEAVYTYVKKHMKWDEYYRVRGGDIAQAWKDKEGSSSEINLLILNLLRKTGIECYPLIFSTRAHGKTDNSFPNLNQFNSTDILVFDGDMYYILDGTAKYQPYNIPPFNILSRDAFIIDPQYYKWVNISDPRSLVRDSLSVTAKIEDDGTLKGETVQTYFDLAKAIKLQEEAEEEEEEDKDKKAFVTSDIKKDTSYTLNKDDDLLPLIETTLFHYEIPSTDDFYFLSPFLFSSLTKNPFTDSLRRSDVDFGANTIHKIHMEIALSPNMKVEELIKNKSIRTADTSMAFNCFTELKNDTIIVNSSFEINRAIFFQEEYEMVRLFFKNIYGLLSNQILLKRKE